MFHSAIILRSGTWRDMDKKLYNVAVVGATGSTGSTTLNILSERKFPVNNVYAFASESSVGKLVSFGEDKTITLSRINDFNFSDVDICFMCAGSAISRKYAQKISEFGCTVIDKTSLFRMDENVPLIVPEINKFILKDSKSRIISNPNCVAIPASMILKSLIDNYVIKKVILSTYQSVSGAGKNGIRTLYEETRQSLFGMTHADTADRKNIFPKVITGNVIPAIGDILSSGESDEESKISAEIKKILCTDVFISVTSVRVPVYIGHSISMHCEFASDVDLSVIKSVLSQFPGITLLRDGAIITPVDAQGEDSVFVCRVRQDNGYKNCISLWASCDNLRKGAALNGVQIAETMLELWKN